MKERLLTGWNFQRMLYLLIGIIVIIQSVIAKQWIGIPLGGYFAAMGLFRFGCAAGGCYQGSCNTELPNNKTESKS